MVTIPRDCSPQIGLRTRLFQQDAARAQKLSTTGGKFRICPDPVCFRIHYRCPQKRAQRRIHLLLWRLLTPVEGLGQETAVSEKDWEASFGLKILFNQFYDIFKIITLVVVVASPGVRLQSSGFETQGFQARRQVSRLRPHSRSSMEASRSYERSSSPLYLQIGAPISGLARRYASRMCSLKA